ncbi:MAG TPA: hypothetical protein ENI68_09775 [Gammaproteobacteria bacterium]|nr:hypothetical protein [Gammaproteobacteria bacterium]
MKYSRSFVARSLFLLSVALLPVDASLAALDRFDPYVSAKILNDSNIFRVSGDFDNEKSETVKTLGVGLNSDLKLSRQHLLLDVEVERVKYDSLGDLDHTRVDGRGTWAWEVGNLWSGNLGYGYNRELASFNQRISTDKDMRATHTGFFSAGYQIHPDWRMIGKLDYTDASYQEQDFLDRDRTAGTLEVQYANTRNTYVGVRVIYGKNGLRNTNIAGVSIDNDYDEKEISGIFRWQGSAKSTLEANLGYTDLKYNDLDDRDYQGTTGRLTYFWSLTGKTKIDISVWRETSSLYDEITTYVLQKGASIRPVWSVTPKINISGEIIYTNDDFKGRNDIAAALGGQRRDDDTWQYRIGASWDPRRYLQVSVNYSREDRDSSIDAIDYDNDRVEAKVRLTY